MQISLSGNKFHELGFKTVAFALRDNCVEIDDEKLLKRFDELKYYKNVFIEKKRK